MRLRALPPSFWQQPNQSNISPGTMYLPPLFKNDNESSETNSDIEYKTSFEQTAMGTKDVKISPANTDLLFKLFENIEPKEKKLVQLNQPNINEQRKEKYFFFFKPKYLK